MPNGEAIAENTAERFGGAFGVSDQVELCAVWFLDTEIGHSF